MKKSICFLLLITLFSCREKESDTYLTPEKALNYFRAVEDDCNRDGGKLWGKKLYAPLMFIDRANRRIIANQADKEGLLKEKDGIFTGLYPKEMLISHAPVKFGGVLFAMAPLPAEEDDFKIRTSAVHGLFHRFREVSGFTQTRTNTSNMDEQEARLWLKLEWKALEKAITEEGDDDTLAIRDALIFRCSHRELYRAFTLDENRFENSEGLATFTSALLCTSSPSEFRKQLLDGLNRVYNMQSYTRSYGYIEGALYATLLYHKGFDFTTIKTDNFDLGNAVRELYFINMPSVCRDVAGSLAVSYQVDKIMTEEEDRLAAMKETIHKRISVFTERPVVFVELESPSFDFEPENVQSFDTLGILYNSMRVSDNWGKLTVEKNGCLVSNNYKMLRIPAKGFSEDKNRITGDGWQLILNDDWSVFPVEQNYFIRRKMP